MWGPQFAFSGEDEVDMLEDRHQFHAQFLEWRKSSSYEDGDGTKLLVRILCQTVASKATPSSRSQTKRVEAQA